MKADIQRVTDAVESLAGTIQAATEQQTAVLRDFVDLIERHRDPPPPASTNGGSATIHVNAGGIGMWAMMTVAAVMIAVNVCLLVAGTLWMGRQDREISEQGHQLNAIYMMAPHLKPEEKKEVEH